MVCSIRFRADGVLKHVEATCSKMVHDALVKRSFLFYTVFIYASNVIASLVIASLIHMAECVLKRRAALENCAPQRW
jgi:hypothetical protein